MSAQKKTASSAAGAFTGLVVLSALAGLLVTVMVTPAIAVTSMAASNTIGIFESLPSYVRINELSQRNTIFAQNTNDPAAGYTAIAEVYDQNREEVSMEEISPYIIGATIAGEDRRFYEHNGVDAQGIVRAALNNATSGDLQGASTLTQQYIKNVCIQEAIVSSNGDIEAERAGIDECQLSTLERKLNEAKLAISLEKEYTKDEILVGYLNIAGFGGNTYGIQAAAQQYFSINAIDATPAQAASLVAIVQQPGARSLGTPDNYAANESRRNVILGFMLSEGFITQAEYDEAIAIPVDENFVQPSAPRAGCIAGNDYAKFFCDYVVRLVPELESLGANEEERRANWRTGGYEIYTTLNMSLQQPAQDKIWEVAPSNVTELALGASAVTVQSGSGRILVMAQNKRYGLDVADINQTTVNFSTDQQYGGSTGFPTGSTYKIFALVQWLQEGRGLNEVVNSSRRPFPQASFPASCTSFSGAPYNPANAGPTPARTSVLNATVQSINTAYVAMAQQMDQCAIRDSAEALGVHRADGAELGVTPGAVLGSNEQAPMTMAAASAALGAGGLFCEPSAVERVVDRDGQELPGQAQDCRQGIPQEIAAATTFALEGVLINGTGTRSNPGDGVPMFGKTGTTDLTEHTWMVGGSTSASTAVWVGNIIERIDVRRFGLGGNIRHEIWRTNMANVNAQYGGQALPDASERLQRGAGVTLPNVVGQEVAAATAALEALGFGVQVGEPVDSDLAEGVIAQTEPGAGSTLSRGQTVVLRPSNGQNASVPDVVTPGFDQNQARSALADAGFQNINVVCEGLPEDADPETAGRVVAQNPAPGTVTNRSTTVTIAVSQVSCAGGGSGGGNGGGGGGGGGNEDE